MSSHLNSLVFTRILWTRQNVPFIFLVSKLTSFAPWNKRYRNGCPLVHKKIHFAATDSLDSAHLQPRTFFCIVSFIYVITWIRMRMKWAMRYKLRTVQVSEYNFVCLPGQKVVDLRTTLLTLISRSPPQLWWGCLFHRCPFFFSLFASSGILPCLQLIPSITISYIYLCSSIRYGRTLHVITPASPSLDKKNKILRGNRFLLFFFFFFHMLLTQTSSILTHDFWNYIYVSLGYRVSRSRELSFIHFW